MKITVTKPVTAATAKSGSTLVADVSMTVEGLPGIVINGFTVWRRPDGSLFVGLPSKATRKGSFTNYVPYFQPSNLADNTGIDAVKNAIVASCVEGGLYE